MSDWRMPENHPISKEKAMELMRGPLAEVYRGILRDSCAPLFWYRGRGQNRSILHNGTVTFLQTPQCLLGVTAAHVLRAYFRDAAEGGVTLQLWDAELSDLEARVISLPQPGSTDIATFRVDERILKDLGKQITPLSSWPPRAPQEGRGIMLAGYPGTERRERSLAIDFGLFTAIVIARTVSDRQITWLVEPEEQVPGAAVPPPPPRYGLGGISGGPLITWIESRNYVASYALGGIISEHPDYSENDFSIERVVACRADLITTAGRVIE